jgi:alginate O-acetyltransferase complex protein AlgI
MLFNSWQFALFFPVVATIHFLMPQAWRWAWLLATSYYFYMAAVPEYGVLLLGSTVLDYALGLAIDAARVPARRRVLLGLSIVANLALLAVFKYFNFFAASAQSLSEWFGRPLTFPESQLLLPVGISFYTFQSLSYTVDVYRGTLPVERHFGRYALYVAYFPQLVAGPIERASRLLPQLRKPVAFSEPRIASGLKLMAWGFFLKLCVADQLAGVANAVYSRPGELPGPAVVLGTIAFAFQIYGDFAGYSLIAIGSSRVLGYELMSNFNRPYAARTLAEFWSRWHMSLSTWFRDYLYIPLGGNRVGIARWYVNLAIVFLISGLWHGANWTFVVWGAVHAALMIAESASRTSRARIVEAAGLSRLPRLHRTLQQLLVFGGVSFAWMFFRADAISDAWAMVGRLPSGWSEVLTSGGIKALTESLGIARSDILLAAVLVAVMELVQLWPEREREGWPQFLWSRFTSVRWVGYVALVLTILNLGAPQGEPFIYFQF